MQVTLSEQGQLTLSKPIRERLHLNPGDRVEFLLDDSGKVELVPVTAPITALKGILPPADCVVSPEEMDAAIHHRVAER